MADFREKCPKCGSREIEYFTSGWFSGLDFEKNNWDFKCDNCGYVCVEVIDCKDWLLPHQLPPRSAALPRSGGLILFLTWHSFFLRYNLIARAWHIRNVVLMGTTKLHINVRRAKTLSSLCNIVGSVFVSRSVFHNFLLTFDVRALREHTAKIS